MNNETKLFDTTGVKVFSRVTTTELEGCIESFMYQHPNYKLIDIKFSTTFKNEYKFMEYSALVIYKIVEE